MIVFTRAKSFLSLKLMRFLNLMLQCERCRLKPLSSKILDLLSVDLDKREAHLRALVAERFGRRPPPRLDDAVVASYFFAFRNQTLSETVKEISYHATSSVKNPPLSKTSLARWSTPPLLTVVPIYRCCVTSSCLWRARLSCRWH